MCLPNIEMILEAFMFGLLFGFCCYKQIQTITRQINEGTMTKRRKKEMNEETNEKTKVSMMTAARLLGVTYKDVKSSLIRLGYIQADGEGLTITEKGEEKKMIYLSKYMIFINHEVLMDVKEDIRSRPDIAVKEDTRSVPRMARELSTSVKEINKALEKLGYLETDATKQRNKTLSKKGTEHGKYICISVPVFDESVFEEVKKIVAEKEPESLMDSREEEVKQLGKQINTSEFFERTGLRKVHGERLPWLMAQVSGLDEEVITWAACEMGLLIKVDDDIYAPTKDGIRAGIREERSVYFNENAQKAVYDALRMTEWYMDETEFS